VIASAEDELRGFLGEQGNRGLVEPEAQQGQDDNREPAAGFEQPLRFLQALNGVPGRWLDVGCAFGFLLQEAQLAGWEVQGLEWSAPAASRASSRS